MLRRIHWDPYCAHAYLNVPLGGYYDLDVWEKYNLVPYYEGRDTDEWREKDGGERVTNK